MTDTTLPPDPLREDRTSALLGALDMLHHYAFKGRHTASEAHAIDGARNAIRAALAATPPPAKESGVVPPRLHHWVFAPDLPSATGPLDVERLRVGFEQWWASVAPKLGVPDEGVGAIHTDIAWQRIQELARVSAALGGETGPGQCRACERIRHRGRVA